VTVESPVPAEGLEPSMHVATVLQTAEMAATRRRHDAVLLSAAHGVPLKEDSGRVPLDPPTGVEPARSWLTTTPRAIWVRGKCAVRVLNPGPPACEAGALPLS
jgi:hypothetical protein